MSQLDRNQQKVLPALRAHYQQRSLTDQMWLAMYQQFQQSLLQLPVNAVKSFAGQLHQRDLAASALRDTIWLTASHGMEQMTETTQRLVSNWAGLQYLEEAYRIAQALGKDASSVASTLVITPLVNKAIQFAMDNGIQAISSSRLFLGRLREAQKVLRAEVKRQKKITE